MQMPITEPIAGQDVKLITDECHVSGDAFMERNINPDHTAADSCDQSIDKLATEPVID